MTPQVALVTIGRYCVTVRIRIRIRIRIHGLCRGTTRQDGLAVFRHSLHVQIVRHCKLREPEMSTGRGRGAEKYGFQHSDVFGRRTFESRRLDTQSQFLGAMTASGTHLGLSELVTSC